MNENVCCTHLLIIECGDSEEHQHIACNGSLDGTVGIDNDHVKNHCLGVDHSDCPLLPRGEE